MFTSESFYYDWKCDQAKVAQIIHRSKYVSEKSVFLNIITVCKPRLHNHSVHKSMYIIESV